jgi:hypothetical protein
VFSVYVLPAGYERGSRERTEKVMNRILAALRDVIGTIAHVIMLPFRVVLRLLSPTHRRRHRDA